MENGTIRIRKPDDWHLHLRQDDMLRDTVPATARLFGRAIIMPNLDPPVTGVALATRYYRQIIAARPASAPDFQPLMTLYLTDETTTDEVLAACRSSLIHGIKLYPRDATTGSSQGVGAPERLGHLYELMAEHGLPLLIHGEKSAPDIDVFDRERRFIVDVLMGIVRDHPGLRIVLEHITTMESVKFVVENRQRMMATITPHHLWLNRNAMFPGNRINPHNFCLPVLKRERHRRALVSAATSGQDCFAAGSDSAPHLRGDKESACGCAGIFNAPCALETYAEVFEREGALDRLEAFTSRNGARFYGLEPHLDTVTLKRQPWRMPTAMNLGGGECVPFRAGEEIAWRAS